MTEARRRLNIYPGQVSMVMNLKQAQEFFEVFNSHIQSPCLCEEDKSKVKKFLCKVESAIETGLRLSSKQSISAKGNS